jgi:adenosylmethionine-8-amino-7-oxononanoate aminotransferase
MQNANTIAVSNLTKKERRLGKNLHDAVKQTAVDVCRAIGNRGGISAATVAAHPATRDFFQSAVNDLLVKVAASEGLNVKRLTAAMNAAMAGAI